MKGDFFMKKVTLAILALVCIISLAACSTSGAIVYDLGNADRAVCFKDIYDRLVEEYGEAEMVEDPTYGNVLKGVAVVRLVDFIGDGCYNLYVAYADGTKPYANRQQVIGFDCGSAVMLEGEITSKSSADSKGVCICLYQDNYERGYVIEGEDLSKSADYLTFVQIKDGKEIYAFEKEFTELDGNTLAGKYDKIELTGITQADADKVFAENARVIDSINGMAAQK